MSDGEKKKTVEWPGMLVLVLLLPVLIPLVVCVGIAWLLVRVTLYVTVWTLWNTRGIRVLYVYSNSPNWQEHIEKEVLPSLPKRRVLLNWSERKIWRKLSLAAAVFFHFGGDREFNPMAVVFKPFRRAKVFRFYKAFKESKHDKPEELQKLEDRFFQALRM